MYTLIFLLQAICKLHLNRLVQEVWITQLCYFQRHTLLQAKKSNSHWEQLLLQRDPYSPAQDILIKRGKKRSIRFQCVLRPSIWVFTQVQHRKHKSLDLHVPKTMAFPQLTSIYKLHAQPQSTSFKDRRIHKLPQYCFVYRLCNCQNRSI